MKRFQEILQRALDQNVHRFELTAGGCPVGILASEEKTWDEFGEVDNQYLEMLFKSLFPEGVSDKPERNTMGRFVF